MTNNLDMVRISVVIISYNQENLISRALDSVLQQKEYGLHKIIVCDDCSQDNTWKVLEEYKSKYDEYLEIHKNEKNLGIYRNLNQAYSLVPNTDIVLNLSGDDIYMPLFFKDIQSWIIKERINPQKDKATLYGDFIVIYPNGKERLIKNDAIIKYHNEDAVSLKIKHLMYTRSSAITFACFKSFDKIPFDKGLCIAEEICDLQTSLHSEKNYYEPKVWSAYYSGIGISTKMNNKFYRDDRINAFYYLINKFNLQGDVLYSVFHLINLYSFYNHASFKVFYNTWKWYFKGYKPISIRYIVKSTVKMFLGRL